MTSIPQPVPHVPARPVGTAPSRDATIEATRRSLSMMLAARAALCGVGAGLATALLLYLAGESSRSNSASVMLAVALLVGLVCALVLRVRGGRVGTLRAALWMEERSPSGYARVALAEDAESGGALLSPAQRAGLAAAASSPVHGRAIGEAMRASARRQLVGPALFTVGAGAALLLALAAPSITHTEASARATMRGGSETTAAPSTPIGTWKVRLVPPAYTGLPARSLGDANSLRALAGSRVEIRGDGQSPILAVRVLGDSNASRRVTAGAQPLEADGAWQTSVAVPAAPLEVRATRGGTSRLLLVDSYADSIPHVTLERPARDSVLRQATGSLRLQATAHDDIGLASGSFELIVSSGEGERFTAKTLTLGAQRLGGARDRQLGLALDLTALKLGPGDVIHLRAVARDAYPLAGREAGSSETRSFRIARASEYDSVAVEPAPPPAVDSSLLSQRMLLMLTERLEKRRPSLQRPALVSESQRIARDQSKLRQSVGNVVFQRLTGEKGAEHAHFAGDGHEHAVDAVGGKLALPGGKDATGTIDEGDDAPIIAINKPLLEAYNAMWDAGRALEQAEPREAIPHMKIALAAIERARAASRLYLRGKPPVVIVDIAKVRLAGKDTGRTNLRSQRAALSMADAARERRLLTAVGLLAVDPAAARDSLAVLRLESVGDAPLFADALDASLDALRGGRDLTPSLLRARRALGGVTRLTPGLWSRGGSQ